MLVLERNEGEQILIGKNIVVTLIRTAHNKARIGIEAPPEIPVHRMEIAKRNGDWPATAAQTGEQTGEQ